MELAVALQFTLTKGITLDLDRVLSILPMDGGVQVTYADSRIETITPVAEQDINRLLDFWLGKPCTSKSG